MRSQTICVGFSMFHSLTSWKASVTGIIGTKIRNDLESSNSFAFREITNPRQNMKRTMIPLKISLGALALGAAISQAQMTSTWTGNGGNANWSTPGNWSPGAPNPGDNLIFDGSMQPGPTNDFAADTAFGNILFASTAAAFTLGG